MSMSANTETVKGLFY